MVVDDCGENTEGVGVKGERKVGVVWGIGETCDSPLCEWVDRGRRGSGKEALQVLRLAVADLEGEGRRLRGGNTS